MRCMKRKRDGHGNGRGRYEYFWKSKYKIVRNDFLTKIKKQNREAKVGGILGGRKRRERKDRRVNW